VRVIIIITYIELINHYGGVNLRLLVGLLLLAPK
jgi:hypothetical protein